MRGTDLIGYAFEAALHCEACTVKRNHEKPFALDPEAVNEGEDDAGIPYGALDCEGNPLAPIFEATELEPDDCCDDCGTKFREG